MRNLATSDKSAPNFAQFFYKPYTCVLYNLYQLLRVTSLLLFQAKNKYTNELAAIKVIKLEQGMLIVFIICMFIKLKK